ncbi:DcaP family trimeric outer membrane transporter [Thalassotalea maritima]|uniref:DcaP family trimeric outer membrane transporter n=1 Tax=Thalassotalea maritima TaxID=3242416 RepID=UPI0035277DCE
MNKLKSKIGIAVFIALTQTTTASAAVTLNDTLKDTTFTFGGYIKIDSFWTETSDGAIASNSIGRQFYVPSTIPVNAGDSATSFDTHARSSRFNFGTTSDVDGAKIKTFLEFDLLGTAGGNELVSNSYSPRLRHAFVSYNNWLVGQTWSTFQNVGALPESIDFLGPADGSVFVRQSQVRYTHGNWQFALENPESLIHNYQGAGRSAYDESVLPDVVARYNISEDWGQMSLAGLMRQLKADNDLIDDTATAFGISVSGKLKVGSKDDIRFMGTYGSGMGRYIGLALISDGVLDTNHNIETIDSFGGLLAYRHFWTDTTRSTISYSFLEADNDPNLTGHYVSQSSKSLHVNLVFEPAKSFTVGTEYIFANRELENGDDGDMNRLQISVKYAL